MANIAECFWLKLRVTSSNLGKSINCRWKFIKISLELGGSAPGIVFADADIDKVLESIYFARFYNSGQVCDGLKRLIVHKSKYDEALEKLSKVLASKKVGDPNNLKTDIGPLVAKRQVELLRNQV